MNLPFLFPLNWPWLEVGNGEEVYALPMIRDGCQLEEGCLSYGKSLVCEAVRGEMVMVVVDALKKRDVDLFAR